MPWNSAAEWTPRWPRACGRGTFDEFVGQEHLTGPNRVLRRAIEADQVPSMLLWGPPGSGKTTLANLIAAHTKAHFETVSAVTAGVADLRKAVEGGARAAVAERAAHHPLRRRDTPLQQGAAGRHPAPRGGRHRHVHRRDNGEPIVRGDRAAAVAIHGLHAGPAHGRARQRHSRPRACRRGAWPRQGALRAGGRRPAAPHRRRHRRRPDGAQLPGAGRLS